MRTHPATCTWRLTRTERAMLDAAAEAADVPVSRLVHAIVIPALRRMLAGEAPAAADEDTARP